MTGALSSIRVLDLSRILAGPWCTQILADLGAEVIKIERPGSGDDTRSWGPPYVGNQEGGAFSQNSAYYLAANRNKNSVTINLSTKEGQELIRELVKQSDVVIENYKVGDMKRYGLAYEDLKRIKPDLIYCSVTGFGQDGPLSHLAGYDLVIQGMGGLMSITGERDDLPGGGPQKVGVASADIMTGMYSAIAILGAIVHHQNTGEGQYIDMALLDVMVATMANMGLNYLVSGQIPKRYGNAHANVVPYQVFDAKDGQIILAVGNDAQFAKFCAIADHPELAEDERFKTNSGRVRNRDILLPLLQDILAQRNSEEWSTPLGNAGIPCGVINNLAQTFNNPQVKHRGMQIEMPHPFAGNIPLVASPLRLSASPVQYNMAPPTLGQHTAEVLASMLGLTESKQAELAAQGVI